VRTRSSHLAEWSVGMLLCLAVAALGSSSAPGATPGAGSPSNPSAEGDGPSEEGSIIRARAQWFHDRRSGPGGVIPFQARTRALEQLARNLREGTLKASPTDVAGDRWVSVGPDALLWGSIPYAGRVTAIATHPTDPNTVYVGTAQGGVWKTTNGGADWMPLTDGQKSLAVGSITIDPSNPNRIYVGTGEPFDGCSAYFGSGILRSEDAGATWTLVGESVFGGTSVSKIVVHPSNPSVLWAANAQGWAGFVCTAEPGSSTYGVRKSTDGGVTWALVLGSAQTALPTYTYDLVMQPGDSNVLYAGVGGGGVWKTTNGGASWIRLAGGLPVSSLGRVDLAIAPNSPQTVYATFERDGINNHLGTWKSVNGGTAWAQLPEPAVGDTCMGSALTDICTYTALPVPGFCNYALYVEVAPSGTVLLGGVGLWRSTNGGSGWIDSCSTEMHVDQHAAAFGSDGRIWTGCDGGVSVSADGGATFANRSRGLVTAQFYPGASLHPTVRDFALGGTQDNGTFRWSGAEAWTAVYTGDGGFTAVDPSSPDSVWYVTAQYLSVYKTVDGGTTVLPAMNGLADAGSLYTAFIAPIVMCPANPSVLVAGSDNVWRTSDGAASWHRNSPDPLVAVFQTIQAIAFAPSDAICGTYFVGLTAGRVYRTTTGGGLTGWTNITGALPARGVSDLAVHPTNANILYAALTGFGTPHVWKTVNALSASPVWTGVSAGLPDTPADTILLDPDDPSILYIGTDVGIFRSADAGASWALFMDGHPNVAVYDLVADASTGTIMSFTYGRGAFRLEQCAVTCPPVGDTLRVSEEGSDARIAWSAPACPNFSHFEVFASTSFSAAFPDEWTLLGAPTTASLADPLDSSWIAYRVRAVDRCGRHTGE